MKIYVSVNQISKKEAGSASRLAHDGLQAIWCNRWPDLPGAELNDKDIRKVITKIPGPIVTEDTLEDMYNLAYGVPGGDAKRVAWKKTTDLGFKVSNAMVYTESRGPAGTVLTLEELAFAYNLFKTPIVTLARSYVLSKQDILRIIGNKMLSGVMFEMLPESEEVKATGILDACELVINKYKKRVYILLPPVAMDVQYASDINTYLSEFVYRGGSKFLRMNRLIIVCAAYSRQDTHVDLVGKGQNTVEAGLTVAQSFTGV